LFTVGRDFRDVSDEIATYRQAVREVDLEVHPLTFWFAKKEIFRHLFNLAICYLSVLSNSVYAERSVSQRTGVNASQRRDRISLILIWLCKSWQHSTQDC
jgi:hypothetical protein